MSYTHPSRRTVRSCVEQELHRSDRIELIAQANALVSSMVSKQVDPLFGNSYSPTIELSLQETDAYHSALLFLERQFAIGPTPMVVHQSKSEQEDAIEWPDGSVTKKASDENTKEGDYA